MKNPPQPDSHATAELGGSSARTGAQNPPQGAAKTARIPVKIVPREPLPKWAWIRARAPTDPQIGRLKTLPREHSLNTVCEEASCPNLGECFAHGAATFVIMGRLCTRRCPFRDVAHGRPDPLVAHEPDNLARAFAAMALRFVMITSVDRNDLRTHGCDMLTIGQNLQPSRHHLPVERFGPPEEFARFERLGVDIGFRNVASGPMVRSSYHAEHQARGL